MVSLSIYIPFSPTYKMYNSSNSEGFNLDVKSSLLRIRVNGKPAQGFISHLIIFEEGN